MSSIITTVAEAVASELNAAVEGTFGMEFTAQVVFVPEMDLSEADSLSVVVTPSGIQDSMAARSLAQVDVSVDIAIRRKVGVADPDALEKLNDLADQIRRYIRQRTLGTLKPAKWIKNQVGLAYSQQHLREFDQFTSVITATYRLLEQL